MKNNRWIENNDVFPFSGRLLKMKSRYVIPIALSAFLTLYAEAKQSYASEQQKDSNSPSISLFDNTDYAALLSAYVDVHGKVDYKGLKANRETIDRFADSLTSLEPTVYAKWKRDRQIAFWINAYNVLTLKSIIDHYPIKAGILGGLRFPKNSIRQISGVWDKRTHPVMGESMTLDHIEHEILRQQFAEPGIHMALVCASIGCPFLRTEPFTGERLHAQLNDQTGKFLKDRTKFRIDRRAGRVYLSPIFKWFGEDFIQKYLPDQGFSNKKDAERSVLNFIANHSEETNRNYLSKESYSIRYLDYDWSLNER